MQADTAVPEDLLHRHIVDTKRLARLDIRNGFIEREAVGVEGDEVVAYGPILNLFVENNFVAENDDIKFAIGNEPVQDGPAGLASRLNIKRTDANDAPACRFNCLVLEGLLRYVAAAQSRDRGAYRLPSRGDEGPDHCLGCGCLLRCSR